MLTSITRRLEQGIELTPPQTKEKFWWNPSITRHKGETYVSFRGYEKKPGIWRDYTSPLAVGKLVNDTVVDMKVLTPENASETVKTNGVEDVRIWSDGEHLMGIGVVLFKVNERRGRVSAGVKQALLSIDYENGTYSVEREYDSPRGTPEKNWSPIDGKPYTYHYAIGYLWENDELIKVEESRTDVSIVHNGTPLIKIGDEYIGVFHQRTRILDASGRYIYRYPNIFIKFDSEFKPKKMSDWFIFDDYSADEVQFISGALLLDDDTLALTVGLDRIARHTEANYKGLLYKVRLSDIAYKDFDYNNLAIKRGQLK